MTLPTVFLSLLFDVISMRADGRANEEWRPFFFTTSMLNQSRGSAYAEFGRTRVIVSVNGPRPLEGKATYSEKGQLSCQAKLSAWAAEGLSKAEAQAMESSMAKAIHAALMPSIRLESFPKSSLDLSIIVIERGGGDLASSIIASSLALASAGVELYDLVPACQVIRVGGAIILDPSLAEEGGDSQGRAGCLMALSRGKFNACEWKGVWTGSEAKEVLELAIGACEQMKVAMKECLIAAENVES